MKTFKGFLPDLLVALVFAVIAFAYFFPADTEGRILIVTTPPQDADLEWS